MRNMRRGAACLLLALCLALTGTAMSETLMLQAIRDLVWDEELAFDPADFPTLEELVMETDSAVYSPELSLLLMCLATTAYDRDSVRQALIRLGFDEAAVYSADDDESPEYTTGWTLSRKELPDGRNLVLIVLRGSVGAFVEDTVWADDWSEDWKSNLDLGLFSALLTSGWHRGFRTAARHVHEALIELYGDDRENTVYVITGHSRGAAVANLLAMRLSNIHVPREHVYAYTFACPDVANEMENAWNPDGRHGNIFNLACVSDPVSYIPGRLGNAIGDVLGPLTSWGKFGVSLWFSDNWEDADVNRVNVSTHHPVTYLRFLRKGLGPEVFRDRATAERLALP